MWTVALGLQLLLQLVQLVPEASAQQPAFGTWYKDDILGHECGYRGKVATGPALTVAINPANWPSTGAWAGKAKCGTCFRLSCRSGGITFGIAGNSSCGSRSVVVQISNKCPECAPAGTSWNTCTECAGLHVDMWYQTYQTLTGCDPTKGGCNPGILPVTIGDPVPCPSTTPSVYYRDSHSFFQSFQVLRWQAGFRTQCNGRVSICTQVTFVINSKQTYQKRLIRISITFQLSAWCLSMFICSTGDMERNMSGCNGALHRNANVAATLVPRFSVSALPTGGDMLQNMDAPFPDTGGLVLTNTPGLAFREQLVGNPAPGQSLQGKLFQLEGVLRERLPHTLHLQLTEDNGSKFVCIVTRGAKGQEFPCVPDGQATPPPDPPAPEQGTPSPQSTPPPPPPDPSPLLVLDPPPPSTPSPPAEPSIPNVASSETSNSGSTQQSDPWAVAPDGWPNDCWTLRPSYQGPKPSGFTLSRSNVKLCLVKRNMWPPNLTVKDGLIPEWGQCGNKDQMPFLNFKCNKSYSNNPMVCCKSSDSYAQCKDAVEDPCSDPGESIVSQDP